MPMVTKYSYFNSRQNWLLALIGMLLTVAVIIVQLLGANNFYDNNPLSRLNAIWYDIRFQVLSPVRNTGIPIVIVDLDELSLQREGRWPWNRAKLAGLISALENYGAAIIGFDMVFSEPGHNPVTEIQASQLLPKYLNAELGHIKDRFDEDAILAQALGANTVLGYFLHANGSNAGNLPPPFFILQQDSKIDGLINLPNHTASLASFTQNAMANGFVVTVPDSDGIVRRMPLVIQHDNGIYSSLSLEVARLALAAPWLRLNLEKYKDTELVNSIRVGRSLKIPVDIKGTMLVPFKGKAKSYTTISATKVLQGDASQMQLQQLNGAIVLVGTSAFGLSDLRTIPLQTAYPGVEVHANVIDTLLYAAIQQANKTTIKGLTSYIPYKADIRTPFYIQPDWSQGANLVLLFISGLILSIFLPGRSPLNMMVRAFAWLVVIVGANLILWHWWHFALPIALQLLLVIMVSGFNIAAGYFISSQQKKTIQSLFGEYVPAAHVAYMLANPKYIALEGEQREMTVLFADVRNFTAMSESLSAAELKNVVNRYLSAITEVIFQHNGTIDKYVGDLVMAFWNAPLADDQHAQNAVACALAMQMRMQALRQEFAQEGLPQFEIGIGVNTGLMNVGDMGSEYRRAYTVMGDAVNLASRLEGLTDFYKIPILVSDTTAIKAADLSYRIIDKVQVKGRKQALNLYQPVNIQTSKFNQALLSLHDKAIKHYQQADFITAQECFLRLQQALPADYLYPMYLSRIATAITTNNNNNWQPVFVHKAK